MKNKWVYISLIIFEIAWGLTYGFFLQNIISVELFLLIGGVIPFVAMLALLKKDPKDGLAYTFFKTVGLSFLLTVLSMAILFTGNEVSGEFIAEYEVRVDSVHAFRMSREVGFTTPDGVEATVELYDFRPILTEEDEYVAVGDVIIVREYRGGFGFPYYKFVEEIYK